MEQSGKISKKLVCNGVSKSFYSPKGDEFKVLDNITFDVNENEFLVLFGPGQCGKTTLLYMLAGIETPTAGFIAHNGKAVTRPDASRAVVYQTMALFPWLTVKGNVEFGPKTRGVPPSKRDPKTQKFIDMVGLTGFENSYPVQLSGGMKQRVGIARAYCNDPDMMQESLGKIWENEKRTVVFVTNNIEEALYLADRIILMSNCPSHIRKEYKIDLPRPRSVVDPEFLRLRQEITLAMDGSEV